MASRVFVSSTCYDLIDIRSEVEADLRIQGLEPVMSDALTSDFVVDPRVDSIETCLANLRSSDHVLVLLSQRYGGRLGKVGFPDVSATHLEYREAVRLGKPIHVYVRDRLEADYAVWKRNPEAELTWVRKDIGVLELLDEHRQLIAGGSGNWLWTFRHSLELKDRIRKDLRVASGEAIIRRLAETGKCPYVQVRVRGLKHDGNRLQLGIELTNFGGGVAIDPGILVHSETPNEWDMEFDTGTLAPNSGNKVWISVPMPILPDKTDRENLTFHVRYGTVEGHTLDDVTHIKVFPDDNGGFGFLTNRGPRLYVNSNFLEFKADDIDADGIMASLSKR